MYYPQTKLWMFFHEDSHMNNENIYLKIIYCNISDYLEHHVCLVVMAVMILNHLYHASHCLFWTEWGKLLLYHCKSKVFLSLLCLFYSYIRFNIINKGYCMDQTPNFALCKGTSQMTWEWSVYQYLLLWLHIYPLVLLPSSSMSGANLWHPFKQHFSIYL